MLQVKELTAGYGDLAAVRDISFDVRSGEVVGLFGANGAGKSTTLLASVGVLPRMSGAVYWQGQHVREPLYRLARRGLAFVPEERSVISALTVRDNLCLGPGGVRAALDHFPELEPLLNRKAGLLSGGEQQILALARAMAGRPKALVVDELSLGLAPLVVDRLLSVIRSAADSTGLAVLLVEQQARRTMSMLDRWYLLASGSIVGEGAGDSTDALAAAYLAHV